MPPALRERALRDVAACGTLCDQRRGVASVGSAARDAAAFAMWAAARAVPQSAMAPLLATVIAPALVVMAVCDREINCRRAAAAAMQENIGRHGAFPDGIAIVTMLDFHAVGSAANCFRTLLPRLAALGAFFEPLLAHVVERTTRHWHAEQRSLAADALTQLAQMRPAAVVAALPALVARLRATKDAAERHGALLALAAVCEVIAGAPTLTLPAEAGAPEPPTPEHAAAVAAACEALPGECAHPAALRAAGGALVVAAAARLVGALAVFDPRRFFDEIRRAEFVAVARLALSSDDADCRRAGASAVARLASALAGAPELAAEATQIAAQFLEQLEAPRTATFAQCGACLAIGALPEASFGDWSRALSAVARTTTLARADCTVRAHACSALELLMSRRFRARAEVVAADALVAECVAALNAALGDRTTDAQGDVGAQVREAAADALAAFVKRWFAAAEHAPPVGAAALAGVQQFVAALPELCFERIDRVRVKMCQHFAYLAALPASPLPASHAAVAAVARAAAASETWSALASAVPLFVPLVACAPLAPATLRGIATALDGATRQLAEQTSQTLATHCAAASDADFAALLGGVSDALATLDARTRPAFWLLARELLDSGRAAPAAVERLSGALADDVVREFARARTFANARNGAPALASCAARGSGATRHKALQQLVIFLACSWPVIRRLSGEQVLRAVGDDGAAQALVRGTEWDGDDLAAVRAARNRLCTQLGVSVPVAAAAATK